MRDAADMAAQSDPVLNPQFSRRWSDRRPTKPGRRAVAEALAMFAPMRLKLGADQHRPPGNPATWPRLTQETAALRSGQGAVSHAAGQHPQICGASQTEATKPQDSDNDGTP